jgi:hypothetical protein
VPKLSAPQSRDQHTFLLLAATVDHMQTSRSRLLSIIADEKTFTDVGIKDMVLPQLGAITLYKKYAQRWKREPIPPLVCARQSSSKAKGAGGVTPPSPQRSAR